MATNTVARTAKGPAAPLRVLVDEELWFGSANTAAAEEAAAQSMAATAGAVLGAKPFPESARRLAELSTRESAQVNEIVQVLEQDPALSAKLLRLVNSAGFALRQPCTSIRHAVTLVGSKQLHQLATTAAVLDLFDLGSSYSIAILEHSAIVGAFCRYLGGHQGLPVEDLFSAGALHDIGKLMFLETFGERYRSMIDQCSERPEKLFAAERAEYGFDHGVLAAHVLKMWNIPDPIPKVVAWHHEPTRAYESSSLHASLVQTLRLADLLVLAMSAGASRTILETIAQHEAASYLDISAAQLDAMWDELSHLYERALRQKRGEKDGADAQANDSATRVKTVRPQTNNAADTPKQFSCAVCGHPSFGMTCPTCHSYLCPEHPIGGRIWCDVCAAEYAAFAGRAQLPVARRYLVVAGVALVVAGGAFGWVTSGMTGMIRGTLAGLGTVAFAAAIAAVAWYSTIRARFRRARSPGSAGSEQ